jgi:hypothetical protein
MPPTLRIPAFCQLAVARRSAGIICAESPELGGGVDPPPDTDTDAEQLAVVPPLEPPQLHVHGPEPATDDAVPAEQRLVEGLDDAVVPFADPHTPLTGAGAALTATVALAAGDVPPLPVQASV